MNKALRAGLKKAKQIRAQYGGSIEGLILAAAAFIMGVINAEYIYSETYPGEQAIFPIPDEKLH